MMRIIAMFFSLFWFAILQAQDIQVHIQPQVERLVRVDQSTVRAEIRDPQLVRRALGNGRLAEGLDRQR